jgi:hypothetical protein
MPVSPSKILLVLATLGLAAGCGMGEAELVGPESTSDDVGSTSAELGNITGTLSLVEPAPYVFGQTVNFKWTIEGTSKQYILDNPAIGVFCNQNGTPVLASEYWFRSGTQTRFALGPTPSWTSGAADCTAQLDVISIGHTIRWATVTKIAFSVGP